MPLSGWTPFSTCYNNVPHTGKEVWHVRRRNKATEVGPSFPQLYAQHWGDLRALELSTPLRIERCDIRLHVLTFLSRE